MNPSTKQTGDLGEKLAEKYLVDIGYIILERNFRCKTGEIDLIGKDGDYIAFIEVKTRTSTSFGNPCEAVTVTKQHKIHKTAEMYIMKKKLYKFNFRFDVIEVILTDIADNCSIRLIKNAFEI